MDQQPRHELKHEITYGDYLALRRRLLPVMHTSARMACIAYTVCTSITTTIKSYAKSWTVRPNAKNSAFAITITTSTISSWKRSTKIMASASSITLP